MAFNGNPRGARFAILALIVLSLWFACTRKSAAEEPVYFAAGGSMVAGANRPLDTGLHVGTEVGHWQLSLLTYGASTYEDSHGLVYLIEPNFGACGTWNIPHKRWRIGWGACFWEHGDFVVGDEGPLSFEDGVVRLDDDGIALTAAISLQRLLGERERGFVEWGHASNAGSTHYNRGRNFFGAGMRF